MLFIIFIMSCPSLLNRAINLSPLFLFSKIITINNNNLWLRISQNFVFYSDCLWCVCFPAVNPSFWWTDENRGGILEEEEMVWELHPFLFTLRCQIKGLNLLLYTRARFLSLCLCFCVSFMYTNMHTHSPLSHACTHPLLNIVPTFHPFSRTRGHTQMYHITLVTFSTKHLVSVQEKQRILESFTHQKTSSFIA